MPRTAGAVNLLIPVNLKGIRWGFPRGFMETITNMNLTQQQIQGVVYLWITGMQAKGYTPDKIKEQRRTIEENPDSQACLGEALKRVLPATTQAAPAPVVPDDEEDDEDEVLDLGTGAPNSGDEKNAHTPQTHTQTNGHTSTQNVVTPPTTQPEEVVVPKQLTADGEHTIEVTTSKPRRAQARMNDITNEEFYHGMKRLIPPDPLAPVMHGVYINGDNPIIDRVYAQGERPLLFVGETATGKTEKAKDLAHQVGRRAVVVGHDAHFEVEDALGKVMPTGDPNHPFEFVDGFLTQAFEKGWTYIADEVNTPKAGVIMLYNQINNMEDLIVRTDAGVRIVQRHPDFRFIGTCNPPESYQGTNEMNLAQLRRFIKFRFDYPPKDKEMTILRSNYPNMKEEDIERIVDFANEIRAKKKQEPDTRYVVHLGTLLDICYLVSVIGVSLREAVDIAVLTEVSMVDQEEYDQVHIMVSSTFPYVDSDENGDPTHNSGISVFGGR